MLVCVGPGENPEDRFSRVATHISLFIIAWFHLLFSQHLNKRGDFKTKYKIQVDILNKFIISL